MKTSKISVYVLAEKMNELMEFLHKRGVMELAGEPDGIPERLLQNFDQSASRAEEALGLLNKYAPQESGFIKKRHEAAALDYAMDRREARAVTKIIDDILRAKTEIDKNTDSIARIILKQKQLSDYLELDVPMRSHTTAHTETAVGSCRAFSDAQLAEFIQDRKIRLYYEVIKRDKQKMRIWCVYLKDDIDAVQEFFRDIEFRQPDFSLSHHTPKKKTEILEQAKTKLLEENATIEERISGLAENRKRIELYYDRICLKHEKYLAVSAAGSTEKTFTVTGYVPEKSARELMRQIENKFQAAAEFEELEEGEELPVGFESNAFTRPVEDITASYSMPGRGDIDPNPIMAVFYYWFFGMMFSDAGYGLLMMIACGILGFSKLMEKEKRQMFKMFFWCGVSTTFWGIAYGSFFGDMIGTVSKTFGSGSIAFSPIFIDPVNQALPLLIISVAFGMIHILTALGIKFYVTWKNGDKTGAVCDVGFWMTLLIGLSVLAAGAGLNMTAVKNTGTALAAGGTVGLLLTGGRKQKSFVMKLFGGIISLYDITGYVGDLLSYSRLMALGLATGVIASVVNVLGSLGGNTVTGAVMFILISVVGHSLNFAINMLGAYVHTNRLQYVEFYQKFYEGGGRKFKPLRMETKYYNFKDN